MYKYLKICESYFQIKIECCSLFLMLNYINYLNVF